MERMILRGYVRHVERRFGMSDFFHAKGLLTVSIGEGWLSSFEAGSLKVGDVVRTGHLAGRPCTLRFNGCEMAPCEVVVIGDLFGVRLTGTEPAGEIVAVPGTRDDLAELLPTEIVLGSIGVSPAELREVGRNTIISLGIPASDSENAELRVAGIPLARGIVVVIEEEFGLRITRVLARPFGETDIRASGFLLDPHGTRRVKDYDFRRPDKFTKIAIENIHDTHCLFLRNLRVRMPAMAAGLSADPFPARVDQLTFGEAREELAMVGAFDLFAAENLGMRRPDREPPAGGRFAVRGKTFLEEEGTANPVAPEVRARLDEWKSFRDYLNRQPVLFYVREGTPVHTALGQGDAREALLSCLRGGWKNLVDLNLRPMPSGDPFAENPWIPAQDMVIITSFKGSDGKTAMAIVYPFLTLEPLLGILG
jgi:flagellar motor switch/type III secretory pathway protein FliN